MTTWVIVGLAGALGATSRHAADIGLRRWLTVPAPLACLVNNRNHRMVLLWTALMVLGGGVVAYAGIILGRAW